MGVVMLIGDVEARFSISFSEVDFQDRRFSTVNGLADIVRERLIDGR
jgi:acyl carrier protein